MNVVEIGPNKKKATGLVVDDDPVMRMLVSQVIESVGMRVQEATNGIEGVELFERERPDILLLDVLMPDMNGFDACAAIRATAEGARVPILMMTGLDDVESINRAFEVGATDFISKPVNAGVLGHRIRYMLRNASVLEELRHSRESLADAQRIARLGSWDWSPSANEANWSDEAQRILELRSDAQTDGLNTLLYNVCAEDRARVKSELAALVDIGREMDLSYRLQFPDGSARHVHIRGFLRGAGADRHVHGTIQDVTDRKRAEEQIQYLSNYDSLTGLPNRKSFMEHVQALLAHSRREERAFAVLSIDIDHFKKVNDTLGPALGDELLQHTATRLTEGVNVDDEIMWGRDSDQPLVARLAGDQFAILLPDLHNFQDAAKVARQVLDQVKSPLSLSGDREIIITASIGISMYPNDGNTAEVLLGNADTAMHHAKAAGHDDYFFYDRAMNEKAVRKLSLETALRRAIDREELEVHYQPKVQSGSCRVVGVEALVRWNHPQNGLISPGEFIPIAEETGLIVPIGDWVLRQSCRQLGAWHRAGYSGLSMAVNIAGAHFREPNLLKSVDESMRAAGITPGLLELEVTESMLMDDLESTMKVLARIRELGVGLAMDDFGTGYSSLAYLKRFVLNTLKIDRAFIRGVPDDAGDSNLVKAVIAMAHGMNLTVVAEGVENEEQLQFLESLSCDMVQGFLISRPAPPEDITPLFDRLMLAAAI